MRIAGTNRGNPDGRSIPDLAGQEGVTVACVCRLLPLICLAPAIVEAILEGRANQAPMLERLERPLPASWAEQRRLICARGVGLSIQACPVSP